MLYWGVIDIRIKLCERELIVSAAVIESTVRTVVLYLAFVGDHSALSTVQTRTMLHCISNLSGSPIEQAAHLTNPSIHIPGRLSSWGFETARLPSRAAPQERHR
jgi:hypothetical protein